MVCVRVSVPALEERDVAAGAEVLAYAGDDGGADLLATALIKCLDGLHQLFAKLLIQGVEFRWSIQLDNRNFLRESSDAGHGRWESLSSLQDVGNLAPEESMARALPLQSLPMRQSTSAKGRGER